MTWPKFFIEWSERRLNLVRFEVGFVSLAAVVVLVARVGPLCMWWRLRERSA